MNATADAAYSERPDPDQPWRYVCPNCGSHNIDIRVAKQRSPGFTGSYKTGGADVAANRLKRYYCQQCQTRVAKVVDKKDGGLCDPA